MLNNYLSSLYIQSELLSMLISYKFDKMFNLLYDLREVMTMVKCNLSVLLAEKRLTISKVSKDTGLSRTTLTALSTGSSSGIQFDTLDTLCTYLNVTPERLFAFAPVNVTVLGTSIVGTNVQVEFEIVENGLPYRAKILGGMADALDEVHIVFDLSTFGDYDVPEMRAIVLLRKLPPLLFNSIDRTVQEHLHSLIGQFRPEINVRWNRVAADQG